MAKTTETIDCSVTNVPKEDVEYLKTFTRRKGCGDGNASVLRWSVIELASLLRAENGKAGTK